MTAVTATPATPATHAPAGSMRTVLRADAVVTGLFGALALLGPASWFDAGWLPRAVGAVLLLVAVEVGLASRYDGRRLRLAGAVTGELAVAWVVASLAVLLLVDLPTPGAVLVEVSAAVTAVFAVLELRLARRLR